MDSKVLITGPALASRNHQILCLAVAVLAVMHALRTKPQSFVLDNIAMEHIMVDSYLALYTGFLTDVNISSFGGITVVIALPYKQKYAVKLRVRLALKA